MDVLKALLWRFHGADGGGRCFPSFERIAAAAKCHRDTVCEAIKALEAAELLTWVHRIARIRRHERDLLGLLATVWQVIRTSNGYRFIDPLSREPGRRGYKSENPTEPPNQDLKRTGARLAGAQVIQEEPPQPPPVPPERPAIAPRREARHRGPDTIICGRARGIDPSARYQTQQSRLGALRLRPRGEAVVFQLGCGWGRLDHSLTGWCREPAGGFTGSRLGVKADPITPPVPPWYPALFGLRTASVRLFWGRNRARPG